MKSFITIICLLVIPSILCSTTYTVDNRPFPIGTYASIQEAHDSVNTLDAELDTILVYPSKNSYSGAIIEKKVVIIGTGWENNTEDLYLATIGWQIEFISGSSGSEILGLDIYYISIRENNILVQRNKIHSINIYGKTKILIIQNWITGCGKSINIEDNSQFEFSNNIIIGGQDLYGRPDLPIIDGKENLKGVFLHNIIRSCENRNFPMNFGFSDLFFGYNIFINTSINTPYPYDDINNMGVSPYNGSVFVDININSPDYHLLPDSPARKENTGYDFDIGIYDGPFPFVDGGYPGLPSILQIESSIFGSKKDGLDVNIKAKSNR